MDQTQTPQQLPAEWLEQIKEASRSGAKSTAWALILGSSVLAALISAGANFWLESRRANVELEKGRIAQVQQSLKNLNEGIGKLDQALDLLIATGEAGLANRNDKRLAVYTRKTIDQVGDLMAGLMPYTQDPYVDQPIRAGLADILDELGPELEKVRISLRTLGALSKIYREDLRPRLKKLQTDLTVTIQTTRLPI